MDYQDLESTLIEADDKRTKIKKFFTKKNSIIVAFVSLLIILVTSLGFNLYSMIDSVPSTTPASVKLTFDDQRIPLQPKVKQNGTTIECQREFFLFHQDQNHVCEVTGLIIKNDTTNVTIIGNKLTNVLYIFNFEVYKLPKEIFEKFTNLKHLIVNGNHLQILETDTFDGGNQLEVLRLSNNDLKRLQTSIFKNLRNLKTLDLGRNKLEIIESGAFFGLESLERIYLSDNFLKQIPPSLFYPLKKLISLSLENNQIMGLDDDTFIYNKFMKSIGLSNNSFKVLQNELFEYFENLTDLSISELRINSLDLNGTSISTLVIRNTDITNITLSNFPKILVSYGTNIEFMKFVINLNTADFGKIPNWGGIFYNKNVRFLFFLQNEIATQENIEMYDLNFRKHKFLPELDYQTINREKYIAVEYEASSD